MTYLAAVTPGELSPLYPQPSEPIFCFFSLYPRESMANHPRGSRRTTQDNPQIFHGGHSVHSDHVHWSPSVSSHVVPHPAHGATSPDPDEEELMKGGSPQSAELPLPHPVHLAGLKSTRPAAVPSPPLSMAVSSCSNLHSDANVAHRKGVSQHCPPQSLSHFILDTHRHP